jgi:apolipoprotein N-acyltransferase
MRTVEEGLPMLRAANTGISAIITSHGAVVERLGLDRSGTVVGAVPGMLPATLFSRLGLIVPGALSIFSCSIGLILGRWRHKAHFMANKSKKPDLAPQKLKVS